MKILFVYQVFLSDKDKHNSTRYTILLTRLMEVNAEDFLAHSTEIATSFNCFSKDVAQE